MKRTLFAVAAALLMAVNGCSAGRIAPSKSTVLSSESDAIRRAIQYTGFGTTVTVHSELIDSAKLPVVVPFLPSRSSHKLWRVRFEKAHLAESDTSTSAVKMFNVCVLLDAENGQLVEIDAVIAPNDACVQPQRAVSFDEDDLHKLGERYTSPPSKAPAITFIRATHILGSLQYATALHALYVLDTSTDHPQPRAMWALTVVGLPPIQPKGGDRHHVNTRSEPLRFGVDAQTGKELFMTNVL